MLNVKKGTALGMQQSDAIGTTISGVTAGMLCHIGTTGAIVIGVVAQGVADLLGFAINNSTDGDVTESGYIGLYLLDGNSILETDQTAATINSTNYPIGTALAGATTTGNIKAWASGDRIVGYVDSIRTIPSTTVPAIIGTTPDWPVTTVLGVKLAV